ncbi:MAG TPA: glycosyltransferase [Methylomirabilota bacterium]|nr:glycosyltransferase [Methylomirabilota bacterium]
MNILMLGPWLPTMRRQLATERLHRFARELAKDHRLTLACTTDHPNPFGAVSAVREEFEDLEFAVVPNRWKRLWSVAHLATGSSAEVAYFSSAALRTRIRDRAKSAPFHLVYVASTSMIPYALELAPSVPVVLDFGDVDSEWWQDRAQRFSGFKTRVYQAEAMRLREVEIMGARRATHCLVATPQAARTVASFAPWAAVSVIGDGVGADEPAVPTRIGGPHLIAFTPCLEDNSEAQAAAEFCDIVLPAVRTQVARTKLLVGCKSLFRLARRLADVPGVEVAAASDLRPLLRRAAVAVAPRRFGAETRRSVLAAMAAGVPVITTVDGLDGLPIKHGKELYLEDNARGFAERLIDLLRKPTLREVMGSRGRAFVRAHCSTVAEGARFSQVIEAAVNGTSRNGSASNEKGAGVIA